MRYERIRGTAPKVVAFLAVMLTAAGLATLAVTQSAPPSGASEPLVDLKETLPLDPPRLDDALNVAVPPPVGNEYAVPTDLLGAEPGSDPARARALARFLHADAADSEAMLATVQPSFEGLLTSNPVYESSGGAEANWGQYANGSSAVGGQGGATRRTVAASGVASGAPAAGGGSSYRNPARDSRQSADSANETERLSRRLTLDTGGDFTPATGGSNAAADPQTAVASEPSSASASAQWADALAVGEHDIDLSTVSAQLTQESDLDPLIVNSDAAFGGGSTPQVIATPEPASLLLFGSGLAATAWRFRRQTKRRRQ